MSILSAIYAGNKGVLKGLQQAAESSQKSHEEPKEFIKLDLAKTQVQASSRVIKISDELLRTIKDPKASE